MLCLLQKISFYNGCFLLKYSCYILKYIIFFSESISIPICQLILLKNFLKFQSCVIAPQADDVPSAARTTKQSVKATAASRAATPKSSCFFSTESQPSIATGASVYLPHKQSFSIGEIRDTQYLLFLLYFSNSFLQHANPKAISTFKTSALY